MNGSKVFAVLMALVAVLCVVAVAVRTNETERKPESFRQIRIESGTTLWEIAEKNCPDDMDKREYISNVQKINGIDSDIYAGDVIAIPIYAE